jgi:hypothetical protein
MKISLPKTKDNKTPTSQKLLNGPTGNEQGE